MRIETRTPHLNTHWKAARLSPFSILHSPFAAHGRGAFTLLELMVSVAILAGIMTMVGVIFSTASKAGGQATASSTLQRHMRQVAETLRRDLRGMTLENRMLAIAGATIMAKDNANDVDTDPSAIDNSKYWHRADLLMLMTDRPMEPYIDINRIPLGGLSTTHQVIYGHANTGKLIVNTATNNGWDFIPASIKFVESGADPASQWQLSRRLLHFPADPISNAGLVALTRQEHVRGSDDIYEHPYGYNDLSNPGLGVAGPRRQVRAGYYEYNQNVTQRVYINYEDDPGANVFTPDRNTNRYRMDAALRLVTARLFDQGYWWSLSGGWTRTLDGNPIPHTPPGAPANPPVLNEFHNAGTALVLPTNLFYGGGASRTVVDPNPPVEAVDALAAVFLPGCSEFQVEYTYDNPRELLVNGGGVILTGFELGTVAAQPIRWESVPAGEVRVWSRLPVDPSEYSPEADNAPNRLNMTFPFRWPRALRVSIRVWDPGNRLSEPLTRTIIHVFDS